MRRVLSGPHATGLAAILLVATAGTQAQAQARFRHDGNNRVIAVSNLSSGGGCLPEISTGTVTEREVENGAVRFITFRDQQHGEIGINVPSILGVDAATQTKLAAAYDTLLQPGQPLRIGYQVCGAAGRIKKLDAISLIGARSAPAALAAGAAGEGALTQAPGGGADEALLRSPGMTSPSHVAAAQPPVVPPPIQPAPAPAPAQNEADEGKEGWTVASDARSTTMGVVSGMHYNTIRLDCVHRTRLVDVTVDDDKGRYRAGSRQSFTLTAGLESVSTQGKTSYNEMDEVRQIHAKVPLEALRPVIEEMARGNPLTIVTRAGRLPLKRTGDDETIASQFLLACGGGR